MKILIAEDQPSVREALVRIINFKIDSGIEIYEAKDGIEALKIIETQPIDILLTDIMMPNIDGFELSHNLKENPKTKDMFIAAITGLSGDEQIKKIYESGIDFYIAKPFNSDDIVARINLIIRLVSKEIERLPVIKRDTLNPYDDKLKNFYIIYTIYQEDDLYSIAEYLSAKDSKEGLSMNAKELIVEMIKVYHSIEEKSEAFEIMLEESRDNIYLSVMNQNFIDKSKDFFKSINDAIEIKYKKNNITIKIPIESDIKE
ncbi:MAG: response regulator [Sulfurimonas sp.]|nr:response regulator [Sulfurimonas sp.]